MNLVRKKNKKNNNDVGQRVGIDEEKKKKKPKRIQVVSANLNMNDILAASSSHRPSTHETDAQRRRLEEQGKFRSTTHAYK
jgi:hypothetical protein